MPWFVALGNHDYKGNAEAQVDYTFLGNDKRWNMPGYQFTFVVHRGNMTAQFVIADTNRMMDDKVRGAQGCSTAVWLPSNISTARLCCAWLCIGVQLRNGDPSQGDCQRWFERVLSCSTADWLFVIGHHAVRSGGRGKRSYVHASTTKHSQLTPNGASPSVCFH